MILVMHSDTDVRNCLVRFLQRSGFDAAGLAAGAAAMAAMRRQRPRLLILNGTLCDMGGIELLRKVRADEALADLPVGFMSGNEDKKPAAERLGIAEYLLMPVFPAVLIPFIERMLAAAAMNSKSAQG
jgi:DNA-binding response OmpR family regulator